MRKVYLHGALAKKYGKVFTLDVRTAGEAIRALIANFPTLRKDISDGSWHVVRGNTIKNGYALDEQDVSSFNLGKADLHIVPFVAGSKRSGGLLKIILGVVLIAAAFVFTAGAAAGLAAIVGPTALGITGTQVAIFGLGLALAGVSMLLAPEEKANDGNDDNSFMTNGPGNNSGQGIPIPLVYGEVITGGNLVSGGVDVERLGMHGGGGGGGRYGGGKK